MASLAMFQNTNLTLSSLDPYNNTFGENNWIVVILVFILSSVIICGMILGTIHIQCLKSFFHFLFLSVSEILKSENHIIFILY